MKANLKRLLGIVISASLLASVAIPSVSAVSSFTAGDSIASGVGPVAAGESDFESFGYNEDQIVSSDVIGMRFGSLFDATQTMVAKIDEGLYEVQVVSWYDNENSYTSQMVRTIKYFAELG